MPEDSKKNRHKKDKNINGKNEPKEQRKSRNPQANETRGKKVEKKIEQPEKVPVNTNPQEPEPEFYKNLKRETDEILKITEESKSLYRKKEIQSNWKKYEVPIASYEDIEEQENMGEDYEKLIQASLSTGSHFQFKHEKTWNSVTAPSEYDKYFEIESESLAIALSSIPFFERNRMDLKLFSDHDISNMKRRAAKFKERYDNEYAFASNKSIENKEVHSDEIEIKSKNEDSNDMEDKMTVDNSDANELITFPKISILEPVKSTYLNSEKSSESTKENESCSDEFLDDIIIDTTENIMEELDVKQDLNENLPLILLKETIIDPLPKLKESEKNSEQEAKKNTAIESPEDLEKWLDDFLDS